MQIQHFLHAYTNNLLVLVIIHIVDDFRYMNLLQTLFSMRCLWLSLRSHGFPLVPVVLHAFLLCSGGFPYVVCRAQGLPARQTWFPRWPPNVCLESEYHGGYSDGKGRRVCRAAPSSSLFSRHKNRFLWHKNQFLWHKYRFLCHRNRFLWHKNQFLCHKNRFL